MGGSGSLTQLIASGALDQYLTANASFTFWKSRYTRHTNFSMESISQPFSTVVAWNTLSQITLNRSGDLIYQMYVHISLPGIVGCCESGDCFKGVTFPAAFDACNPTLIADREQYASFLDAEGQAMAERGEVISEEKWAGAKAAMLAHQGKGHALEPACCLAMSDCPSDCCDGLGDCWAHYTNAIGMYIIKKCSLVIGGSTVDTLFGEFLYIWEELTGKSGKRLAEMVGKRFSRTQLVCDSRLHRDLYVPLPFWFTLHSGNALPLASLQFHGVQLQIEFQPLTSCVQVANSRTLVRNTRTNQPLHETDLKCQLQTTYVYLDNAERDKFATTHFEVLIQQTQKYTINTQAQQLVRASLNFNHPVSCLIFKSTSQTNLAYNNHFNFSGTGGTDPFKHVTLSLNNQHRFEHLAPYLRTVVPYECFSNIPDAFIYVYSFALYPEDASPSGSCNFSRIDNVEMLFQMADVQPHEITIFARNWNVLRFREGLAGIAYTN